MNTTQNIRSTNAVDVASVLYLTNFAFKATGSGERCSIWNINFPLLLSIFSICFYFIVAFYSASKQLKMSCLNHKAPRSIVPLKI